MKMYLAMALLLTSILQAKPDLNHIVKVLKQIESQNTPSAIGDNGRAFGVLQIHKVYVQEVNNRFGTAYTHKEMFQENCAEEVFFLYMKFAAERFEKKYKKSATEQDIVRMHNGGAFQGHRIKATKKYYNKYLKTSKKMKLEDYLKELNKIVEDNPKALKFEVVSASDDEGNNFSNVNYIPSLGNFTLDGRDGVFVGSGELELNPDEYDDLEVNSICIN